MPCNPKYGDKNNSYCNDKTGNIQIQAMSVDMVEKFNKKASGHDSTFVNENHTDQDGHLQLVMMAYRSAVHETTGFTPNLCMLSREASRPLDLMYQMPTSIKPTPLNQCVWELQDLRWHISVRLSGKTLAKL